MSPNNELETWLWEAADQLRANSKLRASEYSTPVLGLIFLKYADFRFEEASNFLAGMSSRRRQIGPDDYQAKGVLYLPEQSRYGHLLDLPEGANIGQTINDAMQGIMDHNRAPHRGIQQWVAQHR
jgi:type I restriction enzyme M protein